MSLPNITTLTAAELKALMEACDARLGELRETEAPILIDELTRRAADLGLNLQELMRASLGKRGRGRPKTRGTSANGVNHN